jgi:serine/threonine protein kinase
MLKKFRERNSTFESGDIDDFKGLVSEYADLGDLKKYLSSATISDELFRQIFFQILYTLSIIYEKYPNFYQGDFKIDNILVCSIIDDRKKYIKYEIMKKTYYLPCSGFQLRLWDFDKCDLGTEKGESGINKDIDLFVRSLLDEFEDSLRGDTKDFIGEIASRDNITPYGFEEYNERRNLETLLEIIWNESSFFKPFLKEPEEGEEITEQYNSDIILSKIIQKPKVVENYF